MVVNQQCPQMLIEIHICQIRNAFFPPAFVILLPWQFPTNKVYLLLLLLASFLIFSSFNIWTALYSYHIQENSKISSIKDNHKHFSC